VTKPSRAKLLRQLARDLMDSFRCDCTDKNGDGTDRCPCGGDGMDDGIVGDRTFAGCWYCQAKTALYARRP